MLFLSASECGKKKGTDQKDDSVLIPECVQEMIDKAKNDTPPTTPLQVDEYAFNGKTVFLFTADCCDFYNVVYDAECKEICAPSGGITGKGDGMCPGFSKEAKHIKTLWKKEEK